MVVELNIVWGFVARVNSLWTLPKGLLQEWGVNSLWTLPKGLLQEWRVNSLRTLPKGLLQEWRVNSLWTLPEGLLQEWRVNSLWTLPKGLLQEWIASVKFCVYLGVPWYLQISKPVASVLNEYLLVHSAVNGLSYGAVRSCLCLHGSLVILVPLVLWLACIVWSIVLHLCVDLQVAPGRW